MPEIKDSRRSYKDLSDPFKAEELDDLPRDLGNASDELAQSSSDETASDETAPWSSSGPSLIAHPNNILNIDARIVGLLDGIVELECLIDPDERRTEIREFDAAYLEEIGIPLQYHQYVHIRVLRSPGKVVHTFSSGDKRRNVVAKLFERVDPFEGLSSDEFNDPVEW